MAADIELSVHVKQDQLNTLAQTLRKIAEKKYAAKVEVAGTEIAAKNIAYLTSAAAKYDAQIKAAEASAKKFAASLQSQMQAEQEAANAHQGMASSMNGVDRAIQESEAAARQFSAALREQMMAEQEAAKAHEGMASSMTVIDRAIQANEEASKRFSAALQQQMEAEQSATQTTDQAAGAFNALAVAVGNVIARLAHMAFQKVVQGVREAVQEMKDVDTELINISKVSGITGKALEEMGDRAYETASKYGVSANEYLSAVYTFQKAGLGPSAEAMGELAVKTMLVGDTTADVASQFLISANAAWKLGGNINELNKLVDEADYINNNYATDLEKLSSGLPRVASIAAQAGMSYSETLAALGTITSVTQESGTKAATALRALILNIEGQIGTFVDDTGEEFEVTEESVKSMQGLMEKYAQAELEAARASGELINPMTAIKAIFDGMNNSDLNDQELFQLLSGMGGKLRTNQLTALVQNWELFDEMLQKTANSAGTADKEIGLMMEGWERKVQVLKNTWTQFIQNIVDSDTIKNAIDELTNFVDLLNSAFTTPAEAAKQKYADAEEELNSLKARSSELNEIEQARLEYLEKQLGLYQEQAKELERQEAERLQRNLSAQSVGTYYDESGRFTGSETSYYGGEGQLYNLRGAYREASIYGGEFNIQSYQEALRGIISDNQEYYDQLVKINAAGVELSSTQQQFITDFDQISVAADANIVRFRDLGDGYKLLIDDKGQVVAKVEDETRAEREKQQAAEEAAAAEATAAEEKKKQADDIAEALMSAAEQGQNVVDAVDSISFELGIADADKFIKKLETAAAIAASISMGELGIPGFASGTSGAPGGPTLVNELGPELISQNGRAFIANGGRPAVVNLQRGAVVVPAAQTRSALQGGTPIYAAKDGYDIGLMDWMFAGGLNDYSNRRPQPGTHGRQIGDGTADPIIRKDEKKTYKKDSGNITVTVAAPAGPTIEELAKKTSDLLSNLDKQAKLANNQGDYLKEVQIYEQAQEAIKKMVDDYRKAGYADDSDEILDLLNKNYDYANKQLSLYQTKWDELINALQADTDAQEMANKLAEKQQAVEDAREALANAQKQRTIRMYNAATGQWEWVADQSKVSSAQEKLSKAEDSYADEVKSQAVKELQTMRDTVTDLNNVILGPALSSVVTMAENSNEFQNFARALNAVYGIGSYLTSTEGNPKAISTADSHDTVYTFGNVTLTEEQASSMSVAQLAQKLSVLKIS